MSISKKLLIFGPENRSPSQENFINDVLRELSVELSSNIKIDHHYICLRTYKLSSPGGHKEVEWQDHHWLSFDFQGVELSKRPHTYKLCSSDIALILLESPVDAIFILDELPQALTVLPYMIFVIPNSIGEGAWARISEAIISLPEYFKTRITFVLEDKFRDFVVGGDKRLLQFSTFADSTAQCSVEAILRFCRNPPAI